MLKKKILCIALSVATAATVMVAPGGFTESNTKNAQAATKLMNPGDLIQNNDFKAGKGLPWNVVETAPSTDKFTIADKAYKINVTKITDKTKESRWSVQFRHRGLTLQAGHTYKVSFTVKADHNCKIYPKIGDMGDPYNEYWNGEGNENNGGKTWTPIELQAGVAKTVTGSFRMDQTVSKCEFAFHLAGDCAPAEVVAGEDCDYSYTFSNVSVKDSQYPGTEVEYDDTDYAVKTNQVGYFTGGEKKATAVLKDTKPVSWKLVNADGETVKTGMTTVFGEDHASGDNVHKIDFSDYNVEGKGYKLIVESKNVVAEHNDIVDADINVLSESPEFEIGNDLYTKMKLQAMKYFYYNRSGIPVLAKYCDDGKTDIARAAGHTADVLGCTPYGPSGPYGTDKPWYNEDYKLDVTGGWYDAGDHGKYVVNGGISTWTLMNQYERALNNGEDMTQTPYADGSMNIPESGNGNPDILDEARFNMEVLLKMQVPDGYKYAGMVHHKAHDDTWTGLAVAPGDDPKERHLQPPSTAATLNMAAAAAQSARLWKDLDPAFSAKCLAASKKAYAAAQKYPKIYAPLVGGTGGGAYGDNNVTDEFYWAAAELYATTGDETYLNDAKDNEHYLEMPSTLTGGEDTGVSGCFDWGNVQGLGTLSLLASKAKLSDSDMQTAKDNVTKSADTFVENQENQGYGTTITESQTVKGVKGYPWGSNCFVTNSMIVLGYANDINGAKTPKYINGARRAMDYILGDNANTQSYVTGYGTKPLQNPHHRWWAYQCDNSFPTAPAGVISGGPNSGLEDPWVQGSGWLPGSRPAAKCYMDNIESWSTNECTINWNAPFAWATSYLDDHKEPVGPLLGDVNDDKKIDVLDFSLLRRYINNGGEASGIKINKENADLNQDGNVNFFDLAALKALI